MNNSIKRAQSQARLSFAERENQRSLAGGESNFRPKVRQYKKLMMTLALLLTAVTGAWAANPGTYSGLVEEITSGGDKTLSHNYYKYDSGLTIVITSSGVIDGNGAIIDMEGANISHVFYISADNVTIKNLSIINYTGTGDAIYFSGSGGSVYNIGYDVALNRATANTWTFPQPGGNVVLTPIYAKTAAFATTGSGSEVTTLLPEAAEGVIAGTDAPLIVEGTGIVAFAGTSTEDKQGTVMYAVTDATANEAPALTAFSATVPTAKNIADGGATVKVWYYIQGADAPQGEAATLDNTFNNSDICATPLTVTVRSNLFDLTLNPANVNTIDAGMATVTVKTGDADAVDKTADIDENHQLKDVKMGSEVTMTTATGYKFRKISCQFHNVSSQAYGICNTNYGGSWPLGFITFNIDDPSNISVLNSSADSYYGLDYCPADGYYYACKSYNHQLLKMDLNGNIVGTVATLGTNLTDGAWNPINNTMYALYGETLYTVNLSTGELTTLVTSENENYFRGIACNADGQLYATMNDGNLYTVNATTGELTLVGATGYNPAYAQSLQFDKLTGNLYWCYSDSYSDHFMQVDPTTGAATMLQANTGETTGLSFPPSLVKLWDTEVKFTMPASDATFNYDIVRDMADATSPVEFSGLAERVIVKKKTGSEAYEPLTALTIQLLDDISGSDVDIISAEGIKVKVLKGTESDGTIEYDETNPIAYADFLADMQPGLYKMVAEPTDATTSPYTGTASLAFEALVGYPVDVAANEYVTYYSATENLTVDDEDAQLYTITAVSGSTATAEEISGANKETPFLVYNSSDKDKTIILIPTDVVIAGQTHASEFVGTATATTIAASTTEQSNYAFNGLQFVIVRTNLAVAANKAWLEVPATTARNIQLVFDDATAIGAVSGSPADNGDIYDLNGRKLDKKPTRKGVYVKNGQKVIIK